MISGSVCVIDVREPHEIMETGEIEAGGTRAINVPLRRIADGALGMDAEDFNDTFGSAMPDVDEDIVFVCKAGVRSKVAADISREANGYARTFNFVGGADEWFS